MKTLGTVKLPPHSPHATGQGRIVIGGLSHYTGRWGTPESEAKARQVWAAYLENGCRPLVRPREVTVGYVADGYRAWVDRRFVKRGEPTSYGHLVGFIMDEWIAMYGHEPISAFGPLAFKALRQTWISGPGLFGRARCRRTVNQYSRPIREALRWAVGEELIAVEFYDRIRVVPPVTARDGVPSRPPRRSVDDATYAEASALLPEVVRAILALMESSGMRPSEACRACVEDIDRSDPDVWVYAVRPEWNKTEHHEIRRVVFLGPRSRAVLLPRIERYGSGPLFRPSVGPRRGESYSAKSLATVLGQYLKAGGLTHFTPNQVRHSAAGTIHRALGMDAARATLGHTSARTTAFYIDIEIASADDRAAARAAALAIG